MRGEALVALLAAGMAACAGPARAAGLPPSVESETPALADAERRLQDATLDLEAARREEEPAREAADAARLDPGWPGGWRLRARLADLKTELDRVEAARAAQSEARRAEFALLSGVEEELRGALESGLFGPGPGPDSGTLLAWWSQMRAWTRRVEALEEATVERDSPSGGRWLMAEARIQQIDRDRRLLAALERRGCLGPEEAGRERAAMAGARARWIRRLGGPRR